MQKFFYILIILLSFGLSACGSSGSGGGSDSGSPNGNNSESYGIIEFTDQKNASSVPVLAMKGNTSSDTLAVLADTDANGNATKATGVLFGDKNSDYFEIELNNQGLPSRVDFKNGVYATFYNYVGNTAKIDVYDSSGNFSVSDTITFDSNKINKLKQLYSENAQQTPNFQQGIQPHALTNPFTSKAGWLSLGGTASNAVGCALSAKAAFASGAFPPALLLTVPIALYSCSSAVTSAFASFTDYQAIDKAATTLDAIGCKFGDKYACIALGFDIAAGMAEDQEINLKNGLVAEYKFNGNANDSSGNGNHGTVHGATLTADRFSNSSSAYSFDGENNNINAGDITSINQTRAFTISGWFYQNELGVKGGMIGKIFSDSEMIRTRTWDDGYLYAYVINNNSQPWCRIKYTDFVSKQKWFFYSFIFDGTLSNPSRVSFYINGNKITVESCYSDVGEWPVQTSDLSGVDLIIGENTSPNHSGKRWNGKIDDIRIYNRALSEVEIKSLYLANE